MRTHPLFTTRLILAFHIQEEIIRHAARRARAQRDHTRAVSMSVGSAAIDIDTVCKDPTRTWAEVNNHEVKRGKIDTHHANVASENPTRTGEEVRECGYQRDELYTCHCELFHSGSMDPRRLAVPTSLPSTRSWLGFGVTNRGQSEQFEQCKSGRLFLNILDHGTKKKRKQRQQL